MKECANKHGFAHLGRKGTVMAKRENDGDARSRKAANPDTDEVETYKLLALYLVNSLKKINHLLKSLLVNFMQTH